MRIAVAQMPGVPVAEWRATLALAEELVRGAANLGAALVVLPECGWPAYCLGSRAEYHRARAGGLPGPELFLARLQRIARDRRIAVCAGYVAEKADRLFNAACLIDAGGRLVGTRHKSFLWAFDRDYFEPGAEIEPLDTPLGRIGIMICADARLPEIPATLAARGAQLILHPTAWVNAGSPEQPWNPQPDFLIPTRAAELGVPIASASKWGAERDTGFVGSSLVCDAAGRVVARCGMAGTEVVAAEVELSTPRRVTVAERERTLLLSAEAPQLPRADVGSLGVVLNPPDAGAPATFRAGDLLLTGPTANAVEIDGVRIRAVGGADATHFATIRCLALRGVHVVVVFGSEATLGQLRTRACENRVFMAGLTREGWTVIEPRGRVVAEAEWSSADAVPAAVSLDVAQAAVKLVAADTDVIAGRTPSQYAV
jgi:predicted amidohydrolase